MPEFPTNEPQIMALVYRMLSGYSQHQVDFPHIQTISRIRLFNAGRIYLFAKKGLVDACAKLRVATKTKNEKLLELTNIMKQSLQKAGVDAAANPEKLKLIGWETKAASQPPQMPGQPTELAIDDKQNGVLNLRWKKPADGGTVYNYIIERRCQNTDLSDNWTLAAISYGCRITLADPPKGIKLEYRVKASNLAGQSIPSNTAAITL